MHRRSNPNSVCYLSDTDIVRPSKRQHSVQSSGSEGNLGRLGWIGARSKGIANHTFVSPDRRLDLGPQIVAGGFLPGIYCLHGLAAEIHALQPAARIWAVKVSNATSRPGHFVAGPNYPDGDPEALSGVPGAFVVQLHQNCEISVEGVAMPLHPVDLDSARTADPGAPAARSGPVA